MKRSQSLEENNPWCKMNYVHWLVWNVTFLFRLWISNLAYFCSCQSKVSFCKCKNIWDEGMSHLGTWLDYSSFRMERSVHSKPDCSVFLFNLYVTMLFQKKKNTTHIISLEEFTTKGCGNAAYWQSSMT